MSQVYYEFIEAKDFTLSVYTDKEKVLSININKKPTITFLKKEGIQSGGSPLANKIKKQFKDYFAGKLTKFDIPYKLEGTEFQKKVWKQLLKIPYGKTLTYGKIAEKIGSKNLSRAVGGACGANNIPIIIPCHRVTGSSGALGGYSAGKNPKDGIKIKKMLLNHESK